MSTISRGVGSMFYKCVVLCCLVSGEDRDISGRNNLHKNSEEAADNAHTSQPWTNITSWETRMSALLLDMKFQSKKNRRA